MKKPFLTRREFLGTILAGGVAAFSVMRLLNLYKDFKYRTETFIAKADNYTTDFSKIILSGFKEIGVTPQEIKGKRILLKPNLVETHKGSIHINTHPLVIHGAAEAFLSLGAKKVLIAEGPGHCRDSFLLVEESGLSQVLKENPIRFIDINYDDVFCTANMGGTSRLKNMVLPKILKSVDWIVSMAKMKTHHWAGVTLSMKNLFGIMPGSYYGWPKNVLHWAGINQAIFDINATIKPHFAIVDGVIGMQGDGPIMGEPKNSGLLVMGRSLPAVDATCARLMGIDPYKVPHLAAANQHLGTISKTFIQQRGDN
ncbi:MAG: DUF362 domain-containing protein, partial [Desulfobacula sp.]|nr:DUF362 domain-containing protein [Desulfobacula sp.]